MSKLLSNLFLVLFSVLVACGQPQAIDSGLLDATVLRFDVRTSNWDLVPLSAVALGEEWRDGDDVFVRTSDGDALVGQISAQELAKADQTWSGLATSPASNGWVRTYGEVVRHVRLTELKAGDRFVYGGRIFETRGGSAVEAIRATGEVIERVVGTHRRVAPGVFDAVVEHADGTRETLTATPEHPFYVPALGDYVELGDLEVGTVLLEAGGGEARLVAKVWHEQETEVFNFEVERTHNYFVRGLGSDTKSVLVHNSCKNSVYRAISVDDAANLAEGASLVPKGTGGTIGEHVMGKATGHISASTTRKGAERFGDVVVEIDVAKAIEGGASFIDHKNVVQGAKATGNLTAKRDAKRAQEVLFKGEIVAEAVKQ